METYPDPFDQVLECVCQSSDAVLSWIAVKLVGDAKRMSIDYVVATLPNTCCFISGKTLLKMWELV